MCIEVKCNDCGKLRWAGCGMHVDQIFMRIAYYKRCTCPGVWPPKRKTAM